MNIRLIDAGQVSYLRSQTIYHALAYAKQVDAQDIIALAIPREPYVSIGFFQELAGEVDVDFCQAHEIPVVRRETGGGTVYIDDNQLFAQWIFAPEHLPVKTDKRFESFIAPLVETYRHFGVNARYQPPNDVHVRNRKIAGTGAARIGGAEVVTGNVLFDFDCDRMTRILAVPNEKFRELVKESLEKYMTSLTREGLFVADREEVKHVYLEKCGALLNRKIVPGDFTDEEYRMMERLDEKFVTPEWLNQSESVKSGLRVVKIHSNVWLHEIVHEIKTGGTIRMNVRTTGKRIDLISLDRNIEFDPAHRLKGLENVLRNVEVSEGPLTEVLNSFYEMHQLKSPGISVHEWVEAILQIEKREI